MTAPSRPPARPPLSEPVSGPVSDGRVSDGRVSDARVSAAPGSPLARVRALARLLDDAVHVPGTRVGLGLDAVLGLIPGVGDAAGGLVSAFLVVQAARMGVPRAVLLRMLVNVGIDSVVGAVPLLGDLFDIGWKANRRNVALIEEAIAAPEAARRASIGAIVGVLAVLALMVAGGILLTVLVMRWLAQHL